MMSGMDGIDCVGLGWLDGMEISVRTDYMSTFGANK